MGAQVKVSVIMPLSNEPVSWLRQSIESMVHQTFQDFELILVIDRPHRKVLLELVNEYTRKDRRVVPLINEINSGLVYSLNRGLGIARGKYIARMDGDDIAFPSRLKVQYSYMEANPEIDLAGTHTVKMDEEGVKIGAAALPGDERLLKKMSQYVNILTHITWMMRRSVLRSIKEYRNVPGAEDYDFVLRMLDRGMRINIIEEPLLYHRVSQRSYTNRKSLEQKMGFKCAQRFRKQRRSQGYDEFDLEKIHDELKGISERTYRRQDEAQALLMRSKIAGANGMRLREFFLLFLSLMRSSIQREYYFDWLLARILVLIYSIRLRFWLNRN